MINNGMLSANPPITLCRKQNGCCPTIQKIDDYQWRVSDDYGTSVDLTVPEMRTLARLGAIQSNVDHFGLRMTGEQASMISDYL